MGEALCGRISVVLPSRGVGLGRAVGPSRVAVLGRRGGRTGRYGLRGRGRPDTRQGMNVFLPWYRRGDATPPLMRRPPWIRFPGAVPVGTILRSAGRR